jgi:cytochrome c oxidase subunit 2
MVLGGTALLLSGCSWQDVLGLGWPNGITPEGKLNRDLWLGSVIASFVVGAIVWALIFWASAFHRKKKGDNELPRQFGYNMPLELVLTVIPFLIISVLFYFTVVVQERMLHKDPQPRGGHRRDRLPVELEVRLPEDRLLRRHVQLRRRRRGTQGCHDVQARG